MADLNKVILVGRLTKDVEVKYTQSGKAIGEFSIAVNSKVKKNEQWIDEVSYFDCNLFGQIASSLQSYLLKGKQISLSGALKQQRWTSQDGQNKSKIVINVEEIQLLGGKNESTGNTSNFEKPANQNSYTQNKPNNYQRNNYQSEPEMPFTEDIPF